MRTLSTPGLRESSEVSSKFLELIANSRHEQGHSRLKAFSLLLSYSFRRETSAQDADCCIRISFAFLIPYGRPSGNLPRTCAPPPSSGRDVRPRTSIRSAGIQK